MKISHLASGISNYYNRPLLFITITFILGIIAGDMTSITFIPSLILFVISLVSYFIFRGKSVLMFMIFFFLGILLISFRLNFIPTSDIQKIPSISDAVEYTLIVNDLPRESERNIYFTGDIISFRTKTQEFENISGKVRVTAENKLGMKIRYGDILEIQGRLKEPPKAQYRGGFDYRNFLRYKGVSHVSFIRDYNIKKTGRKINNYFRYFSYMLKDRFVDIIYSSLPLKEAKILDGIMLGNQKIIPIDTYDKFKITGTVHILAVSGMNVGLIALFTFLMLKLIGIGRKRGAAITIIFITVFAFITGADASIVRATIMAYVILMSIMIERDADIINAISIAALIILLYDPTDIFNVGFQLSFLATFGIVHIAEWGERFFKGWPEWISLTIISSVAAQLFLNPVLANTFHQISIISILANLIIVPLSGVITILGFVMWGVGLFSIAAAKIFGASIWLLVNAMMIPVDIMSLIPYASVSVTGFPPLFAVLYYIVLIILPYEDVDLRTGRFSFKRIGIIVLVLWGAVIFTFNGIKPGRETIPVTGINAELIRTHSKKNILILSCDGRSDFALRNTVIPFIRQKGINTIDVLINLDLKNRDNAEHIIRNFHVKRIIYSENGNLYEMADKGVFLEVSRKNAVVLDNKKRYAIGNCNNN